MLPFAYGLSFLCFNELIFLFFTFIDDSIVLFIFQLRFCLSFIWSDNYDQPKINQHI